MSISTRSLTRRLTIGELIRCHIRKISTRRSLSVVAFVTQKIGNAASQDEMITMALQVIVLVLLTFSLIFSLTPIIKDILYRDYNKYNDFIYDLRQIKLFYSKKNATYSNLI